MMPATAAIPQKVGKKLWKKAVGCCESAALAELHKKRQSAKKKLSLDKSNKIDGIGKAFYISNNYYIAM